MATHKSTHPHGNEFARASERPSTQLNFELIRLFVLTADRGTITAAANELELTPSHATRKLADLERQLKVRLFQRTTRRMDLTEAGAVALEWARQALDAYSDMTDSMDQLAGSPSGLVRILANQYAAERMLPSLILQLRERYPGLRISVGVSDDLSRMVEGHFDLAVHTGSIPDSSLVARKVREFERILCATPKYLQAHGIPRQPTDLGHHACLVHTLNEPKNWFFQKGNEVVCQSVGSSLESDSHAVLLELARQSLGILRFSRNMLAEDLAAGTLVPLMEDYRCVYSNSELPGLWVVYPNRKVLLRTRIVIDFLVDGLGRT